MKVTFWPDRGRNRSYWKNILVGADQSLGTIFGIDSDETISSWCGRNKAGKWQEKAINWLFNDPTHCRDNIEVKHNCT
jgi:hypothetical protein